MDNINYSFFIYALLGMIITVFGMLFGVFAGWLIGKFSDFLSKY